MDKVLKHYGIKRLSGRYPWGSGGNAEQRNRSFLGYVSGLQKSGLSEKEIAEGFGMSTTELRNRKSIAKSEIRAADSSFAMRLKEKGMSNIAIGERMGINESSVRNLLKPSLQENNNITRNVADVLKKHIEDKNYIDVGVGTEHYLGVNNSRLKTAVALLQEEGYTTHYIRVPQLFTNDQTSMKVLAKPDTTYSEVYKNRFDIKSIPEYSDDGGRSFYGLKPIEKISRDRILVKYGDEGGSLKDGVIEIRKNVSDLDLGDARYAQVRIGVDNNHYMKGMAMYSTDVPKGYDVIYNTNKPKGSADEKVFKPFSDDPDNPFGAIVRQKEYEGSDGKKHLSALNIVGYTDTSGEEGSWGKWSKTLSSQVLSKQSPQLAKQQLDLAYKVKKDEYDEIMQVTNPNVKRRLLEAFADNADSAAVHLKAAALPRQQSHVILPIVDMKPTEVYAPNYRDGESVVLIRYPHGGIFEIPELKVNNKHSNAKSILGAAKDAIGINPSVAEQLSGADFDGDTVLVIPNNNKSIKTSAPLQGLKNFDPKTSYPAYEGMPIISAQYKNKQMGIVSNLITDMTIKGASVDELCRAVKHSMVVIDSEKHKLNYKQSAIDNGIKELQDKYQSGGASTIVSAAKSEARISVRKPGVEVHTSTGTRKQYIDPQTGKKLYTTTPETYVDKNGKTVERTKAIAKLALADDARTLSSGSVIEEVYASHSNRLKDLANQARKDYVSTEPQKYSPTAKQTYANEVASLNSKLILAQQNAPLERQALLIANATVSMKSQNNPELKNDTATYKKIKAQALNEARNRTGAHKQQIEITDSEWNAIQAGAISSNKLDLILNNTNLDSVKVLATPRNQLEIPVSKQSMITTLTSRGYTTAEIADQLGLSTTTINKYK